MTSFHSYARVSNALVSWRAGAVAPFFRPRAPRSVHSLPLFGLATSEMFCLFGRGSPICTSAAVQASFLNFVYRLKMPVAHYTTDQTIFRRLFLCLCGFLCFFDCLFLCFRSFLFLGWFFVCVCLVVCFFICLFVCLSARLLAHVYKSTSVRTYVCMYLCLSVCLFICVQRASVDLSTTQKY